MKIQLGKLAFTEYIKYTEIWKNIQSDYWTEQAMYSSGLSVGLAGTFSTGTSTFNTGELE